MPIPFIQREKTIDELQDEEERTNLQYSIEQKRAAIREAKKRGVSLKSFGGSFSSLIKWLKEH
jgi:hypothetical protein